MYLLLVLNLGMTWDIRCLLLIFSPLYLCSCPSVRLTRHIIGTITLYVLAMLAGPWPQ